MGERPASSRARSASALATAEAMVGRATLPPDADKGPDVEYQLGEHLGTINRNL